MSKSSAQPPKGTRDFLPQDVRRREFVTGTIRRIYETHGFEPLETPAIERLSTLLGKYGDEGDQLLFKLLLRGQPLVNGIRSAHAHLGEPGALQSGRSGETAPGAEPLLADLGMRYDLTVPLARVFAAHQNALPSPFKRYQIQPVWRADTPGKGRFREFYQCDVDICGSSSRLVEAEVVAAACRCLRELGFESFSMRLNHRQLLRAIIETAGIPSELETDAIVAIDKLDKVGTDGVAKELESRGIEPKPREALLALLGEQADLDHIAQHVADNERGAAAVAELRELLQLAATTPAAEHLRFDVSLARGLGYYTGCIFEIAVEDLAGSLGGGGRYDGLIGMFLGREVPACGLSLGLERILVVMDQRDMFPETLQSVDLVLGAAKDDSLTAALQLATELRAEGVRVDLRPDRVKPGKLRKQADESGIAWAAWLEGDVGIRIWSRADGSTTEVTDSSALLERLRQT